jgi:NitT/TauT family transport system permease protein
MSRPADEWQRRLKTLWGGTQALLERTQRVSWVDLLVFVALGGLLYGVVTLAQEWTGPHQPSVAIDLSPWALPRYTFFSLTRGLIAYGLSLAFTLVYGYWAAKDRVAERGLIPLLDILQSIPVLAFMPGVVRGLAGAFPGSNVGLELASVVLIFTGQAWNMTFSFYHSLRSIPPEQREAATIYGFSWWQRLKWLEVPFATMGLVWNSMMSMAGGWFFLMTTEAFSLGPNEDYRLPGLGSYMKEAVKQEDVAGMIWGVSAMVLMIVALDQLLWRPVTVWAQKYRVEEGGYQEAMSSWFLNLLRRSRVLAAASGLWRQLSWERAAPSEPPRAGPKPRPGPRRWGEILSLTAFLVLLAGLGYGTWRLALLLTDVTVGDWAGIGGDAFWTFTRVAAALVIGTLWTVPAGLVIGLSPRLSRILQPVVQVVASFPAPMLFWVVIWGLTLVGVTLGWGSVLLLLLGTQWYILFNVIAGAMAIPADLKEAARSYCLTGWRRFWQLYVPAIFPYLVTGWITAAGGAWNASIIAEYVEFRDTIYQAHGLGARISSATAADNIPELAACVLTMSLVVVLFNRLVWKRLYRLAEERFALAK